MEIVKNERERLIEQNTQLRSLLQVGVMLVETLLDDTLTDRVSAAKWIKSVTKYSGNFPVE